MYISEYTGRWIDIWTDRIFWQRPGPVAGFISLTDALDTCCIDVNQRLVVARKISRMFHVLHSQNIIQKDFQAEDIFVTEANGVMHFRLFYLLLYLLEHSGFLVSC